MSKKRQLNKNFLGILRERKYNVLLVTLYLLHSTCTYIHLLRMQYMGEKIITTLSKYNEQSNRPRLIVAFTLYFSLSFIIA